MSKITVPAHLQNEYYAISPEHVRISSAAAIALGLKSGRVFRDAHCGCVNLLEHYPQGCFANCVYCGLARERPGVPEDNTFIRVAWPLYSTQLVADKIAEREREGRIGRVCVSQVQDHRANADMIEILTRVHDAAPAVPLSALVSATLLDEEWLRRIQATGVDIIGIGLDAATEDVFNRTRGKDVRSPHDWDHHWQIIRAARRLYGPLNVNCHIIVGLGETDRDLVNLFAQLHAEQIAAFLFSFNPEPGSAMQDLPRQPIRRWRRVQLAKYLIENDRLTAHAIQFDAQDNIAAIDAPPQTLAETIVAGRAFMTNGCPDRSGNMTCNRPYGSYRPGEEFRDYPFVPTADDLPIIREQLGWDA
ncbi:MAG: radical SAM protein [Chloroflexi bacterium]|nr:radical SAM protein [Chloroflexota bacterium]